MDENDSEAPSCNPSAPEYLIGELEKIKGDAIGDTLYSERWVLKTLMKITKFSDDSWDEQFESELCALWDMTLEKDVVHFLMDQNVFMIINDALQGSANSRFIEILVGILGNMCCLENVRSELMQGEEMISLLLKLFDRPEPHILIQLVRLLNCVAWDLIKDTGYSATWLDSELSNSRITNHLFFILKSSTNEELLFSVLELLNTLCGLEINDKDFSQYFCRPEMVQGMIECWEELFGSWTPDENFSPKTHYKAAARWASVLASFTGYEAGRNILCHNAQSLGQILKKVLQRPDDCIDEILISSVSVLEAIITKYFDSMILLRLLKILNSMFQNYVGTGKTSEDSNFEGMLFSCIESYFVAAKAKVHHTILNEALSSYPENLVLLFWKAINDKQVDNLAEKTIEFC